MLSVIWKICLILFQHIFGTVFWGIVFSVPKKFVYACNKKFDRHKPRQMMNAAFFYVRISRFWWFQFPPWGIRQSDGKNHFFSIWNFDDISSGLLKMINGRNIELSLRLNCYLVLLSCNVMIIDNLLAKIIHFSREEKWKVTFWKFSSPKSKSFQRRQFLTRKKKEFSRKIFCFHPWGKIHYFMALRFSKDFLAIVFLDLSDKSQHEVGKPPFV